uniref:FYVE-type domain-containing protein n=1 Tax=Arcella intermedia TaxID=1963864 RepID=A0A6B2L9Q0_9EUKA
MKENWQPDNEAKACGACMTPFNLIIRKHHCRACGKIFCNDCCNFYTLPPDKHNMEDITRYCEECFINYRSSLNFNATFDVIGPEEGPAAILVHGGSTCRAMWSYHVKEWSKYMRCYCIDLPGHGSLMHQKLSMDAAVDYIIKFVTDTIPQKPVLYIGGSLGGYIGMEVIGKRSDLFYAAVIADAGQNVGKDASLAAKVGLTLMELMSSMSNDTLLKFLMAQCKTVDQEVLENTAIRPGMYFNSASDQVAVLEKSNPFVSLPKFQGPIMFANGTMDHRDSEAVWQALSKNAKLKLYHGDHFFLSDKVNFPLFVEDVLQFARDIGFLKEPSEN